MASRRPQSTTKTQSTPPSVEKHAPAAKTAPAKKTAGRAVPPRNEISEDMRRSMIAQGAYLRAERRGFRAGDEVEDWMAAEAEVDALLKAGSGGTPQ